MGSLARMPTARYDGIAQWYDNYIMGGAGSTIRLLADDLLVETLGTGSGRCLDLGCGTGGHADALRGLGWTVIGIDLSVEQVRIGRRRQVAVVADAATLPFADGTFDAVTTVMGTTDFDDLGAVVTEAERVLAPHGRLVVVGAHPCFGGAFAERRDDGSVVVHDGYRERRQVSGGHPMLGHGLRARVGARNLPLTELFRAVLGVRLRLDVVAEDGGDAAVPHLLALAASKPADETRTAPGRQRD